MTPFNLAQAPAARPLRGAAHPLRASIEHTLAAAALAVTVAAPAMAKNAVADPDSVDRAAWRLFMAKNPAPANGCFHASYPAIAWEEVPCKAGKSRVGPGHSESRVGAPEITGGVGEGNNDYVVQAPTGLIGSALGFFEISGVKDESGVAIYNNPQAITGSNEYSIQLNTNKLETTSACAGKSGCHVWQQFVYATDYVEAGEAAVFMQFWLLDWGSSTCPGSFVRSPNTKNCYFNSALVAAPDIDITDLGDVSLSGSATAGGNDSVFFMYASEAYTTSYTDSALDIATVWNKAEFNVLGNGGGARALFNYEASVTVNIMIEDGSYAAPWCIAADGTTGESNNLTAGTCTAEAGIRGGRYPFFYPVLLPSIQFTETNND